MSVLPSKPVSVACSTDHSLLNGSSLGCRRGRRWLFKGLNLRLSAGSITWLRGRNGSGKTSLLRILAGLSSPTEGSVEHPPNVGADSRTGVLYIGHANALKDDLTLVEAVAFLAQLQGLDDAPGRAHRALALLGLSSRRDAPVRTLSQGQRRRGALARLALDDKPMAWILDEPYDALDQDSTSVLTRLIEEHAARRGAVLLTSHQPVVLHGAAEFDLEPWRVP